jgi:Flp pilus assembly protein TadD/peroxiredoxin
MSTRSRIISGLLAACLTWGLLAAPAFSDELRNLRRGEPLPAFKLVTSDGEVIDSEAFKGRVLVMVYLAGEQRSSELAAIDATAVVQKLKGGGEDVATGTEGSGVELLFITADVVRKAYFQRFRQERGLEAPLLLDADRSLYGKLGLIVFPTTIIVNREGNLAQVISLHNPDYSHLLDSNIRHILSLISDEQLRERLKARPAAESSPKRVAAAHRALARQMREQGGGRRLASAREELIKARDLDPTNPETLLDLADIDVSLGHIEEADQIVAKVLAENAGHRRAKEIRGIILYRQNRSSEAENVLLEALDLNPDPARIHYYLGALYEQQGQTAKALEHYRRALERYLDEPETVNPARR